MDSAPTSGREQAGRRPVLVVSHDAINRQPLVVTVVVGTDATRLAVDYPTNVRVTASESGLPRDTMFLCFQIRSLDPSRFTDPATGQVRLAGRVTPERMSEVDAALRLTLALWTVFQPAANHPGRRGGGSSGALRGKRDGANSAPRSHAQRVSARQAPTARKQGRPQGFPGPALVSAAGTSAQVGRHVDRIAGLVVDQHRVRVHLRARRGHLDGCPPARDRS